MEFKGLSNPVNYIFCYWVEAGLGHFQSLTHYMSLYRIITSLVVGVSIGAVATDFGALVNTHECQAWVDSVYNTMTPRERVAQLFCPVVDPTKGETSRALIRRYAGTEKVGGLLLRRGSVGDYASMINLAQSQARIPVMMTLDGEWGLAMRIGETPQYPYNMALGAISDTRLLQEYGAELARQCREMGIHVDFAPVADVNLNPANPVIGRRSFGEDPERVAAAVVAMSRGMEQGGVITTAKHFPGHGDTSTDSHKTLPVVDHSKEFMWSNDLVPFKRYIDAGMSGIMVGHLSVPAFDATGTPASMSNPITTGVLREQMGFNGLIFTDALEMKGAIGAESNNCIGAFKAGADMLLSSLDPPIDITALLNASKRGDIDPKEIERRCRKILAYKWALGLAGGVPKVDVNGMKGRLDTQQARGLKERLTAASATVTGNTTGILPLKAGKSIAVVSLGAPAHNEMSRIMERHAPVDVYSNTAGSLTPATVAEIKKHDVIVVGVFNDGAATINDLKALEGHSGLVPVMMMTPYKAMKFKESLKQSAAMLMMYDDNETARRVAADALFGGNAVSGRLPVSMPGVAAMGDGVSYPATRLSFSMPHATSMSSWLGDSISAIVNEGVRAGAFPGIQVMVIKDGKVVADVARGHISNVKGANAVTHETLFDLASMSKVLGTLPVIMKTTENGKMDLDTPIGNYLMALADNEKGDLTPRMLLTHESGMPASLDMANIMFDPDSYSGTLTRSRNVAPYTIKVGRRVWGNANARLRRDITSTTRTSDCDIKIGNGVWVGQATADTLLRRIYDVELRDRNMRYSCLNFCLLMEICQQLNGQRHDSYLYENIVNPIGANMLCYRPLDRFKTSQIAATENDRFMRRQVVHGYVHDELAAFSGGVQGNAGLFGSATDVAKMCQMYLNGGSYGGTKVLNKETVKLFTTTQSANSRRGLGFDRPDVNDLDRSPVPEEVPASAYGHTGFTGTCMWVDPDNQLIYVFLSNRVNPSRDNAAWNRVKARSRIHAILYRALE